MSNKNITELLQSYGAWVRDDKNDLGYGNPFNAILAAAPHLADDEEDCEQPVQFKNASHMTDLDAAVVDTVLIRLAERHYHLYVLLMAHYVKQWSERKIARKMVMSRNQVGKDVCKAEGVLEGLLMRL